jgi:hypothetical protein
MPPLLLTSHVLDRGWEEKKNTRKDSMDLINNHSLSEETARERKWGEGGDVVVFYPSIIMYYIILFISL